MTKLITSLALSFVCALWYAFVISKLWLWFAVTAFATPKIDTFQIYGLLLVLRMVKVGVFGDDNESKKSSWERAVEMVGFAGFALGFGYLAHVMS